MKLSPLALLLFALASCTKEKVCDEWHTGDDCKTERRFELTGTYSGYEVHSGNYNQYKNINVYTYTDDLYTITINGKVAKLLNPKGNFEIPLTQTSGGYSYEGQGHFDGYQLSYGYNTYLNDSLVTIINFQGTK